MSSPDSDTRFNFVPFAEQPIYPSFDLIDRIYDAIAFAGKYLDALKTELPEDDFKKVQDMALNRWVPGVVR